LVRNISYVDAFINIISAEHYYDTANAALASKLPVLLSNTS